MSLKSDRTPGRRVPLYFGGMGILPMSTFQDVNHAPRQRRGATSGTVFRAAFVELPNLAPIGSPALAGLELDLALAREYIESKVRGCAKSDAEWKGWLQEKPRLRLEQVARERRNPGRRNRC
jgi:hypothetical protein